MHPVRHQEWKNNEYTKHRAMNCSIDTIHERLVDRSLNNGQLTQYLFPVSR